MPIWRTVPKAAPSKGKGMLELWKRTALGQGLYPTIGERKRKVKDRTCGSRERKRKRHKRWRERSGKVDPERKRRRNS